MKFKGMEKVWDLMILNVLFLVTSLPIVTVGASATALQTALRRLRAEAGHPAANYFAAFRLNFRQATVLWLLWLLAAVCVGLNFRLISGWTETLRTVVTVLLTTLSMILLGWCSVVFPLLSRFDNTTARTARNALILCLASPLRTAAAAIVTFAPAALAIFLPNLFLALSVLWLILLCSATALLTQLIFTPLLKKLEKPT